MRGQFEKQRAIPLHQWLAAGRWLKWRLHWPPVPLHLTALSSAQLHT
jgi:hypothetical protein